MLTSVDDDAQPPRISPHYLQIDNLLTMTTTSSSAVATPKMSNALAPPPLSKPVIFATSGLGGMLGWAIVHPANTAAGMLERLHLLVKVMDV